MQKPQDYLGLLARRLRAIEQAVQFVRQSAELPEVALDLGPIRFSTGDDRAAQCIEFLLRLG